MAELNTSAGASRHQGIARSKKLSTRVDLTPMVDLGFLLITFFVFTTTVTEPKVMQLYMPADSNVPARLRESTTLTIIPLSNDKVFYYHGQLQEAEKAGLHGITNFSITDGIGAIVRKKQAALNGHPDFKASDMVLIIRPTPDASYQNIVNALDEVLINDVKHYSFVDLTPEEIRFLETRRIK